MIKKILIANRGEIAIQIIKKCHEMDIETVAIYSEADKNSLHIALADEKICIGPVDSQLSYMNINSIIEAAKIFNADAIHPGYGFLAENSFFAKKCEENGIIFIGSRSNDIELFGNKEIAKGIMNENEIPIIHGNTKKLYSLGETKDVCKKIGYPIILKSTYGGGGKGITIVRDEEELLRKYNIAKTEAKEFCNRSDLYVEKYIENARHIEFQMIADKFKNIYCIGIRDCTTQKNSQKIIEETSNEMINDIATQELINKIIKTLKKIGFYGIGTVEFLKDKNNNYFFLEMNVRLQVEYKVTELTSNVDIIRKQIEIANNQKINVKEFNNKMHCIEVRINATKNIKKIKTKINRLILPIDIKNVYYYTHIYEGYSMPIFYDSMICKILVVSTNRKKGIMKMKNVLNNIIIDGIETNINQINDILNNKMFQNNTHTTNLM